MKKTFAIILFMLAGLAAHAQYASSEIFPHYKDHSIPKPEGVVTDITAEDLALTDKYLDLYPEGFVMASNEVLHKLYDFFRNDPSGKKEWEFLQDFTLRRINSWNIYQGSVFSRYIQSVHGVQQMAMVYIYTGNKLVSQFIREHLKKLSEMPLDFWVHAELRGLDPKLPCGTLETAAVNRALSVAVEAVKPDMTPEELAAIEKTWREYGLQTNANWIRTRIAPNNFTAVISSGTLWAAKYFGDKEAEATALYGLKYYLDNCFETDGSYQEGASYFTYPVTNLVNAALVMTPEQVQEYFGRSYLKDSMSWRLYGFLFDTEDDGAPGVMRISYGDNPYGNREMKAADVSSAFARSVYKDPVAVWFREKFGSRENMESVLLHWNMGSPLVLPLSPVEAGLPLAKCFVCGDNYIRSTWDDNGIVFGIKTGDCNAHTGYYHQHAELNSIALGAYGEYLIVTAGSASYRSRLHYEYDVTTRAANTITIDGMNQKNPRKPAYKKGKWDNRSFWCHGYPHAVVTKQESYDNGDFLIRSDAPDAYHIDMKEASRTVKYVADGGFFIIKDIMAPSDSLRHHYDYRLHIFNRDNKTVISEKKNYVKVERGSADLYIYLFSDSSLSLQQLDGYLHHPIGRDYDADGPKQGKPGSAIELDWSTDADVLDVTAVLYPVPAGAPAPKVRQLKNGKLSINGKVHEI